MNFYTSDALCLLLILFFYSPHLLIDGNIGSKIRDSYLIEIMDVLMLTVLATNSKLLTFGW